MKVQIQWVMDASGVPALQKIFVENRVFAEVLPEVQERPILTEASLAILSSQRD
jgi:hypothetical protein